MCSWVVKAFISPPTRRPPRRSRGRCACSVPLNSRCSRKCDAPAVLGRLVARRRRRPRRPLRPSGRRASLGDDAEPGRKRRDSDLARRGGLELLISGPAAADRPRPRSPRSPRSPSRFAAAGTGRSVAGPRSPNFWRASASNASSKLRPSGAATAAATALPVAGEVAVASRRAVAAAAVDAPRRRRA